jgi:hypothetical protein
MRIILILFLFALTLSIHVHAKQINVIDYGAKPDGVTVNTAVLQKAIDDCSSGGGGTVYFPAGKYVSGSIFIKDNVTLYLENNALLLGVADESAYPGKHHLEMGFIRIHNVSNVSIIGEGVIDGNGGHKVFQKGNNGSSRPFLVHCRDSRNITIKGVTLRNSAFWTLHLSGNETVRIDGLRIYSHSNWNNDGIDIDSRDVVISNCIIDVDDDAICFKSESEAVTENVTVTNCVIASNCNFIKFGTRSFGGFKNISVNNCVLRPASESNFRFWAKQIPSIKDSITGIAGIALEVVDGGTMDQVTISNISMQGVQTPVFMRLGSRTNATGSLKNVLISNIVAQTHSTIPSSITAVPGFYVENVVLRDVIIKCMGGGRPEDINTLVPEKENSYPENRMFGTTLPAYGMFVRHAQNITLDNVQLLLQSPDGRPALYFEDVHNLNVNNLQASSPKSTNPLIWIKQVKGAWITSFKSNEPLNFFIQAHGNENERINLFNNDFHAVKKIAKKNKAVIVKNNF